jgi:hypothetical protein
MGTPPSPFTDQPPGSVDIGAVAKQELDPTLAAYLGALGIAKSGLIEKYWGTRAAAMVDSAATIAAILTGNWDKLMTIVGTLFLTAQGEKNSAFYDLAAAVTEDLTGVKVDAAALKQSTFGSGRLAGMETLGGNILDLLAAEFAPKSGDLEEGDDAAAKKFLGFLMNFSIRQGNVTAMCEAMPKELGFLSGFRDYGEQMAKNLGLGRMARRALQPLIQVLVADPLLYKLQEQYRPKRIGSKAAIQKFFRDATFKDQMMTELAQEGFTDDRIDDLITDARPLLKEKEIVHHLFRFGDVASTIGGVSVSSARDKLTKLGYAAEDLELLIEDARPMLDKAEIGLLFANGIMAQDDALLNLSKLGYDDTTAALVLQAHSFQHRHPRQLGLAELKKAFHNSVIDLLELKAHLSADGYSDDDIQIITLDLLQPTHGKVRQLSLAEIKAGFKAGVLTEQQAAEHLKTLGFSDADIEVIVKTLPAPKAPAPAAAPASSATVPTAGAQGVPRAPE